MIPWIAILVLWNLAFVSPASPEAVGRALVQREFYLGGTQVNEPDHESWAESLAAVGMNTVAVTTYARQREWDSDDLTWVPEDPAVIDEIRAARARGLNVVLVLRVVLDHAVPRNRFLWHGQTMPRTAEVLESWFHKYGEFALKWARIAEREGVAILGIGSEMKALSATLPVGRVGAMKNYYGTYWYQRLSRSRALEFADQIDARHLYVPWADEPPQLEDYLEERYERHIDWARHVHLRDDADTYRRIEERRARINGHWLRLIAQVRGVFGGKLTYAANFDNYRNVGFWRHLDLIGINGYFPLRDHVNVELEPDEQLRRFTSRWVEIFNEYARFRSDHDLGRIPLLFTEIGYTSRRHTSVEPWSYGGFSIVGWKGHARKLIVWDRQPIDYGERARAIEAMRRACERAQPDLQGILYWKLSTRKDQQGIEPFMVHLGEESEDPAQGALLRFLDLPGQGAFGMPRPGVHGTPAASSFF